MPSPPRRSTRPRPVAAALLVCALSAAATLAAPEETTVPPPARTLSLSEYRALISRARQAAKDGLSPAESTALSRAINRAKKVSLPSGDVLTVKNEGTSRALQRASGKPASSPDVKKVIARLENLEAALSPPASDGQTYLAPDAGARAARILAAGEFRRAFEPLRKKGWWERTVEKALRSIEAFFRWLFGSAPDTPKMGPGFGRVVLFLLYFLAAVGAVVALYFLGRALYARYGGARGGRSGGRASLSGLDLDDDGLSDPLGQANALAAQGDLRGALRLAYIAALRRLEGAGLLTRERNKTNWEYQRALRSRSRDAYETLLPATRLFDRVWYGRQAASREEFEAVVRIHDALPAAHPLVSVPKTTTATAKTPAAAAPRSPSGKENPW